MEYFASVCKFRGWSRILLCWSTPKFGILLKSGFQMSMVTVDRVLIVDTWNFEDLSFIILALHGQNLVKIKRKLQAVLNFAWCKFFWGHPVLIFSIFLSLTVILTVDFGQMHYICIYSYSAGRAKSEPVFSFQIHVTVSFNGFFNRHFDQKLVA